MIYMFDRNIFNEKMVNCSWGKKSMVNGLTNLKLMMNIPKAAESLGKLVESFEITFIG